MSGRQTDRGLGQIDEDTGTSRAWEARHDRERQLLVAEGVERLAYIDEVDAHGSAWSDEAEPLR